MINQDKKISFVITFKKLFNKFLVKQAENAVKIVENKKQTTHNHFFTEPCSQMDQIFVLKSS